MFEHFGYTNGNVIRVNGREIELTEENIFRYVIPYVDKIDTHMLLYNMIKCGYFKVIKYLVEYGIEITYSLLLINNIPSIEIKEYLEEHCAPQVDIEELIKSTYETEEEYHEVNFRCMGIPIPNKLN